MGVTRERRSLTALGLAVALVAAAIFFGGGSGDGSLLWLGGGAALVALWLFASAERPAGLVVLVPFALLAGWSGLSVAWSVAPDRSWSYANRIAVYALFALVGALLRVESRRLVNWLGVVFGAVCVWALATKAFPGLHASSGQTARLATPVDYWNGLALLADVALPIGLCIALRRRIVGALLVYGALVVIGLTYSRGGIVVGLLAVGAWFVMGRSWHSSIATTLSAALPASVVLAVAFSLRGVTDVAAAGSLRHRHGLLFAAVLLAGAVIVAGLARVSLPRSTTAGVRRLVVALLVIGALAGSGIAIVRAGAWWESFTSPAPAELANTKGRLLSIDSNFRWEWWTEALEGWKERPWVGTGAGTFSSTNLRYRTSGLERTLEPHELPVQFLSETGVVGLGLFLAAVGWLVVAGKRRPGPQLALALALPTFLLHGLIDVGWDFAAVAAPVFLIAGSLISFPSGRRRPGLPAIAASGGLILVLLCSLGAVWLGARWSAQAQALIGRDDQRVIALADRARRANPLAVEPLFWQAAAATDLGSPSARAYLARATRMQPRNAQAWLLLGLYDLQVSRCPRAALPELSRFTVLDGKSRSNVYYAQALALVNSGVPRC